MSRPLGLLIAVVSVVLLLFAGCTTSNDDSAGGSSSQGGSASGSAPTDGEDDATGATAGEMLSVEAEPGAPLEISEEEEAFLAKAEAPADVYDGAVIEAGYEACLRIEFLASVDEDVLREALASGEISDGVAAINTLCPEFAQYLPAG